MKIFLRIIYVFATLLIVKFIYNFVLVLLAGHEPIVINVFQVSLSVIASIFNAGLLVWYIVHINKANLYSNIAVGYSVLANVYTTFSYGIYFFSYGWMPFFITFSDFIILVLLLIPIFKNKSSELSLL